MSAEIPGIEIENDYSEVQGPAIKPEAEKGPMNVRELALAARANAGLSLVGAPLNTTRGVNERGMHDNAPMIDITEDGSFLPGKSKKIESSKK